MNVKLHKIKYKEQFANNNRRMNDLKLYVVHMPVLNAQTM